MASFPGLDSDETNVDSIRETIDCTPDVNGYRNVVERLAAKESTRLDQEGKRGSNSQLSVEQDESVVGEPAVGRKNKVGRPRRNDESGKRKRGRPPKSSLIREKLGTSSPNDQAVKRKRGRPPKSSVKQTRPETFSQNGDAAKRERDGPPKPEVVEENSIISCEGGDGVEKNLGRPPATEEDGLRSPRDSTSPERSFSRAGTRQRFHRVVHSTSYSFSFFESFPFHPWTMDTKKIYLSNFLSNHVSS